MKKCPILQIFMLVIMVCFKLYAAVSRSAALIGDVSVALMAAQPSTGSRWQQRQMISPTEYIHHQARSGVKLGGYCFETLYNEA